MARQKQQPDDLKCEKGAVQPARWKGSRMQGYEGHVRMDLIHEYRKQGLEGLCQAREECERVVGDMAQVFGELHFISLVLYTTFGDLLDELGELSKSKALRMRIREQIENTHGTDHPYYIQPLTNVVRSHEKLGNGWKHNYCRKSF